MCSDMLFFVTVYGIFKLVFRKILPQCIDDQNYLDAKKMSEKSKG